MCVSARLGADGWRTRHIPNRQEEHPLQAPEARGRRLQSHPPSSRARQTPRATHHAAVTGSLSSEVGGAAKEGVSGRCGG
eukprot:1584107-Pyramimonas_sp.AAC.1